MPTAQRVQADSITHIVAQDGSGEFATIAAAVAAAGEGYTVLIRPGTYDESISLDKAITIAGDGEPGRVVIQPSSGAASFTLGGSGATLADLTLRGRLAGVSIIGGAPTLDGLVFEAVGLPDELGAGMPAISVTGGSTALIRDSTIAGGSVGVMVSESAPTLEGNMISANATGLQLGPGAVPTLTSNTICLNTTDIEVLEGGVPPDLSGDAVCGNPVTGG